MAKPGRRAFFPATSAIACAIAVAWEARAQTYPVPSTPAKSPLVTAPPRAIEIRPVVAADPPIENVITLGRPMEIDSGFSASNAAAASDTYPHSSRATAKHTVRQMDEMAGPYGELPKQAPAVAPFKPISIDALLIGRAGMDAPATNVKMTEVGGSYTWRKPFGDRFLLQLRPFADILFLSGPGGAAPDLPEQLYKVATDVQLDYQINDWLGLSVGVTPGIWSDFVYFEADDMRLPARALGTARASGNLFFAAGILYTDNYYRNLLPTFGVIWDPVPEVRLEMMWPRLRAAYFLREDIQIYGVFERGGDTYNIRTELVSEDFQYRDLRFLLGTQVDVWSRATFFVEAGFVFDRRFRLKVQDDFDAKRAFILRAGTRF